MVEKQQTKKEEMDQKSKQLKDFQFRINSIYKVLMI